VVAKCFVFTGVASAIPGSLPLEIKTIRVIKKPFTLVVPIFDKFPTGWDPTAFDGKQMLVR